jgi:hypothetical protein
MYEDIVFTFLYSEMPQKYYRKTAPSYDATDLVAAVEDVKKGVKTICGAARFYSVPKQTIWDHVKGKIPLSSTRGRPLQIPCAIESRLAIFMTNGSRLLEWSSLEQPTLPATTVG